MTRRCSIFLFAGWLTAHAGALWAYPFQNSTPPEQETPTPEAGGEHLRVETEHGPLHLWWPENLDPSTAGMVIYIHGYHTTVDITWTADNIVTQLADSRRNALFMGIGAPESNADEVSWKSLEELLRTVAAHVPYPLPHGPLVIIGHSGAYRTILQWLSDPRVQYIMLLDALYAGQVEFRAWLRPRPRAQPHRMVLVSVDTWRQSNRLARRVTGTVRRRGIPIKASAFTPRETHARLLYIRAQYPHADLISNGRVIPVLLQISPLKPLRASKANKLRPPKESIPMPATH